MTTSMLMPTPSYKKYAYMNTKFAVADYTSSVGDVPYMRAGEMYLIEAEGYARAGEAAKAQDALYTLAVNRDPSYVKSTKTGQGLIDEIMIQRRVELWGEGFRFLDLKRLNLPLDRTGANHEVTLDVKAIDTRNLKWNIGVNFAKIDNYVDELAEGVNSIFLGGFVEPQIRAGIGDKFPVIYGVGYLRNDEGKIVVDEKTKRVSSEEFEIHKKHLTKKTIFLSINGTIGNLAFYNNEMVVLGKSACYITPSQKLNNVFLYYSLQSPRIIDYFFSELTGSTIKNLSLKSIRETLINLPSEREQQKIATCRRTACRFCKIGSVPFCA